MIRSTVIVISSIILSAVGMGDKKSYLRCHCTACWSAKTLWDVGTDYSQSS